jgi:DNA polymerase (family 10)
MVADLLVAHLAPYSRRIQVAGSIRRQKPMVGDVELLAIPDVVTLRNLLGEVTSELDTLDQGIQRLIEAGFLAYRLNRAGHRAGYGPKNKLLLHVPSGIPVDVFCTTEERWAMSLVIRTGPAELNKRLAAVAQAHGMKAHAYGEGFTLADGSALACKSEEEVFAAVGWPYLPPEERK